MRSTLWVKLLVCAVLFCFFVLASFAKEGTEPLTNESVIQMLQWKASASEIVGLIQRNQGNIDFTLSADSIKVLTDAGANQEILDAMYKAVSNNSKPVKTKASSLPPTAHSSERLANAQKDIQPTVITPIGTDAACRQKDSKEFNYYVYLNWDTGTVSPGQVDRTGPTCFELTNPNTILFEFSLSLKETQPQGSALDLLKDSISGTTGLLSGSTAPSAKPTAAPTQNTQLNEVVIAQCPKNLQADVDAGRTLAAAFPNQLATLQPTKDSSGKIKYIPLSTTLSAWTQLSQNYESFEKSVQAVVVDLRTGTSLYESVSACNDTFLAQAESLVLDVYPKIKNSYVPVASRVEWVRRHATIGFADNLEATSSYDVTATATSDGAAVLDGTKSYHLNAGHKLLTASGGFLVTMLPAPSYTSRTVPTGGVPPAPVTQNVLGVDDGQGPRIALAALLNFHPGQIGAVPLTGRRYGLALTAGPVFDVSNGKADTSKLGFFGGVSLQLWDLVFITPGIHVGEFGNLPQGYMKGTVIPPNTGTPQATKQWTARFAVGITFKIKDFGETPAKTPAATPDKPQPAPKKAAGG